MPDPRVPGPDGGAHMKPIQGHSSSGLSLLLSNTVLGRNFLNDLSPRSQSMAAPCCVAASGYECAATTTTNSRNSLKHISAPVTCTDSSVMGTPMTWDSILHAPARVSTPVLKMPISMHILCHSEPDSVMSLGASSSGSMPFFCRAVLPKNSKHVRRRISCVMPVLSNASIRSTWAKSSVRTTMLDEACTAARGRASMARSRSRSTSMANFAERGWSPKGCFAARLKRSSTNCRKLHVLVGRCTSPPAPCTAAMYTSWLVARVMLTGAASSPVAFSLLRALEASSQRLTCETDTPSSSMELSLTMRQTLRRSMVGSDPSGTDTCMSANVMRPWMGTLVECPPTVSAL
mmetsp:Transcript_13365/g.30965  ORF Transcript_13365/g.30965 Transcript_13365/m.30965 type:complete len:347 (-) Transcript_13365:185-1225(-)